MTGSITSLLGAVTDLRKPAGQNAPNRPRLLVVDDDPNVRAFLIHALGLMDCEVLVASNGADALNLFRRCAPIDLLLSDVMMPEMNGLELGRRVRLNAPDLKVLYLTGHADALFEERPALWENEAFLEKPCTICGLHEAISLGLYRRVGALVPRPNTVVDRPQPVQNGKQRTVWA